MTVNEHAELSVEECWEFLRRQKLGRLAYHLVDEVHIVPINFVVDDQRIVLRTVPGSKLIGITMNNDVAFETDEITGDTATSVVVRGRGRELEGDDLNRAEQLNIQHTLPGGDRYRIIAIDVTELTGQRFPLLH